MAYTLWGNTIDYNMTTEIRTWYGVIGFYNLGLMKTFACSVGQPIRYVVSSSCKDSSMFCGNEDFSFARDITRFLGSTPPEMQRVGYLGYRRSEDFRMCCGHLISR